jgi:transposase
MEMLGKLRRMRYRDGLSRAEIARRTGLSRTTVKKWLRAERAVLPRYRRAAVPGKLAAFKETLVSALEADARRPKRERRTGKALHGELRALGYAGGYTVLMNFIRRWREQAGANAPAGAFVPLKFELGEAFQFDWSEERALVGGIWRTLQVAHLKLCASRAFVLTAYPTQGHEMLFDAHTRALSALGGIPRRGIYENAASAQPQHEDRRRQGQKGQGTGGQRPLLGAVCALPVRAGFLQRRLGLGRGRVWQSTALPCRSRPGVQTGPWGAQRRRRGEERPG